MKLGRFSMVLSIILVFMLILAGCSSSSTGSPPASSNPPSSPSASPSNTAGENSPFPPAIQSILDAGKQEGNVTLYGITTDPGAVKSFEEALQAFYGFPIKVNMISGLHPQKASEIIAAGKSGVKSGVDIFHSAPDILVMMDREGLLEDVKWTEELELDAGLGMLGGKALRMTDRFLANVIYNKDLVKPEELPKTYDDLLDPKWSGKIIIPRGSSPYVYIAGGIGEEYTDQFVEGLAKQNPMITAKFPDIVARVGAGEFPIGIGIEGTRDARRGAPIADSPIEPVIITPWGNSIMKDAEHPNAAKLVTYYLSTKEGQQLMDKLWSVSLSTVEGTASYNYVQGKEIKVVPESFIFEKSGSLLSKYAEMLGFN